MDWAFELSNAAGASKDPVGSPSIVIDHGERPDSEFVSGGFGAVFVSVTVPVPTAMTMTAAPAMTITFARTANIDSAVITDDIAALTVAIPITIPVLVAVASA